MRIAKCAAVLAVLPMLTAAKAPLHLQPSSKWVLDYADNSCRLLRTFGEGDDKSTLVIERVAPGQALSMLVMGKPFAASRMARDFTARFAPLDDVKALNGSAALSSDEGKLPAILWPYMTFQKTIEVKVPTKEMREAMHRARKGERPPAIEAALMMQNRIEERTNASNVKAIEILRGHEAQVVLDTGSLGTANRMMDQCARDQLSHWGVDPDTEDKIVRRPFAQSPMSWFSYTDYPMESLRKNQESALQVRLLVDAEGKVTKCTPMTFVADEAFPKKVCEVFSTRGHFEPAELADGTKVPSYYVQRIQFRL